MRSRFARIWLSLMSSDGSMSRPGLTLVDVVAEVGGRWQVCRRVAQLAASGQVTRAAVIAAELCLVSRSVGCLAGRGAALRSEPASRSRADAVSGAVRPAAGPAV